MKWTPCGPRATLIEFPRDLGPSARSIEQFLLKTEGITDFSIAFDKVLLEFEPDARPDRAEFEQQLSGLLAPDVAESTLHEIPVAYDGLDLADVAERHGLSISEVVEIHSAPIYEVALLGFSPGFPYLTGLDRRLHTPRRSNPRSQIPVGSVAIGEMHTGIYSVESPGGWNLIGSTEVRLFDFDRRDPDDAAMFLLRAGDRVKFVPSR